MPRRTPLARAALFCALLGLPACATIPSYTDPTGPEIRAPLPGPPPHAEWRQPLRIVTWNIEYGEAIEAASERLEREQELAGADVVLLQEVDGAGAQAIATRLGMALAYHPASRRGDPPSDFGNAVLSRWPISAVEKLILPHRSIVGRTARTATVATLRVGRTPVRVYSIHLATPVNQSLPDRREQLRAVLDHARTHPHVIIGGDFNSAELPMIAEERTYRWPTRSGPWTTFFGRVDHIVFKGFDPPAVDASGTVTDVPDGISDHLPVWAVGRVR